MYNKSFIVKGCDIVIDVAVDVVKGYGFRMDGLA